MRFTANGVRNTVCGRLLELVLELELVPGPAWLDFRTAGVKMDAEDTTV